MSLCYGFAAISPELSRCRTKLYSRAYQVFYQRRCVSSSSEIFEDTAPGDYKLIDHVNLVMAEHHILIPQPGIFKDPDPVHLVFLVIPTASGSGAESHDMILARLGTAVSDTCPMRLSMGSRVDRDSKAYVYVDLEASLCRLLSRKPCKCT